MSACPSRRRNGWLALVLTQVALTGSLMEVDALASDVGGTGVDAVFQRVLRCFVEPGRAVALLAVHVEDLRSVSICRGSGLHRNAIATCLFLAVYNWPSASGQSVEHARRTSCLTSTIGGSVRYAQSCRVFPHFVVENSPSVYIRQVPSVSSL